MDHIEYQLMDLKGILLLRYKELQITELELVVLEMLLLIDQLNLPNYHDILVEKTNLSSDKIDEALLSLIRKKWIGMDGMKVNLDYLKTRLTTISTQEEVKAVDLLAMFESEFGRALSPSEIEAIRHWKNNEYDDQMIIDALKESSLRGVFSIRYIEAILKDWKKNGVKRTGKVAPSTKKIPEYNDYHWWEEE